MRPADVPDEVLARRGRSGEQEALRLLCDRHAPRLNALGREHVPSKMRSKVSESDIVQEALTAALGKLDQFEDQGPGSFERWLRTIYRHKAEDAVRRYVLARRRDVRREVPARGGTPNSSLRAPARSPSSLAAAEEHQDALRAAIERTRGDDRQVLELVHRCGLDFAEVGRLMGRSADAARKLYGRVILRLAKDLRQGR